MSDGTCQFKLSPTRSCRGNWVGSGEAATAICNCLVSNEKRGEICQLFYREVSLAEIKPAKFCCQSMEHLFHLCAEEDGCYAGAFDIRKYPNDRKDVWRNYERVKFTFCPFCGTKQGSTSYTDEEQRAGDGAPSPARS